MASGSEQQIVENEEIEEYLAEINIPETIYGNLWHLKEYRGIEFSSTPLSKESLAQKLKHDNYVELKGARKHPNGTSYLVSIVLIAPGAEEASRLQIFRKLLNAVLKSYKKTDNIQLMTISSQPLAKAIEREMESGYEGYPNFYFEYYTYENFIIVKPLAQICPKEEILPPEEVEALCTRYNTRKEYWPRISAKDAQALWVGPLPGDVIKVTRNSDISGKAVIYKFVT